MSHWLKNTQFIPLFFFLVLFGDIWSRSSVLKYEMFNNVDKDTGSEAVFLKPVSGNGLFACWQHDLEEVGIVLSQSIGDVSEVQECDRCAQSETPNLLNDYCHSFQNV